MGPIEGEGSFSSESGLMASTLKFCPGTVSSQMLMLRPLKNEGVEHFCPLTEENSLFQDSF